MPERPLNQCVLGIQVTVWECQILDVAHLDSLSGIQETVHSTGLLMCVATNSLGGILFPPDSYIYCL